MNKTDPNTHRFRNCVGETDNGLPNAHAYMPIPLHSLSTGIKTVVKFTYSFKNRQRKVFLCK